MAPKDHPQNVPYDELPSAIHRCEEAGLVAAINAARVQPHLTEDDQDRLDRMREALTIHIAYGAAATAALEDVGRGSEINAINLFGGLSDLFLTRFIDAYNAHMEEDPSGEMEETMAAIELVISTALDNYRRQFKETH
jgi:hypothetical protein